MSLVAMWIVAVSSSELVESFLDCRRISHF
jgi:hypothetical protein